MISCLNFKLITFLKHYKFCLFVNMTIRLKRKNSRIVKAIIILYYQCIRYNVYTEYTREAWNYILYYISTRGKGQHFSEKITFSYGSFILLLRGIPKISWRIVLRYFSFIFATEW